MNHEYLAHRLNRRAVKAWATLLIAGMSLGAATGANAQLMDSLKSQLGNSGGTAAQGAGGGAGLGSLAQGLSGNSAGSLTSSSTGNVAGVIQYCVKNNYLGDGSAASIKDKLMSRIPGNKPTADPGYLEGAKGILTGNNGEKVSLGGGGLKDRITQKACETILKQGKSLL